ncbi:MAG: hypothetical protein GEU28_00105 [Dehalococcoidia bacterium]|nr:hypothetical protein [Dehalococcoidia bacterium]
MKPELLLNEHLGEDALGYLLNLERHQVQELVSNPDRPRWDERREAAIQRLSSVAAQLQDEVARELRWSNWLGSCGDGQSESVGTIIRQSCGGEIKSALPETDPVTTSLTALAIDLYAVLLVLGREDPRFGSHFGSATFRHPLDGRFQEAVLSDKELVKLFPHSPGQLDWQRQGNSLRSTGQGGGNQLAGFASSVITAGLDFASLAQAEVTVDSLVDGVRQMLTLVRSAIAGRPAVVPVRIGLTGVILPDTCQLLDLGWAKLRPADDRDERIVRRTALEGRLQGHSSDGDTVIIRYSGDVVLETELEYQIEVHADVGTLDSKWPNDLAALRKVDELVENVRLGILLACPDARPLIVAATWRAIIDPLSAALSVGWSDPQAIRTLTPTRLADAQAAEWAGWSKKIHDYRAAGVSVAIRRMLMATADRRLPEDVLVDAIVVWENLFGGANETTLRVSTALAWLLASTADARRDRQKRFKKIYGLRSRVVHGAPNVNQKELQKSAVEAVQVSLEALRQVFGDRTDLLRMGSGAERSEALLLGGWTEGCP